MSHPQKGAAVLNVLVAYALIFAVGYGVYEIIPRQAAPSQVASARLAVVDSGSDASLTGVSSKVPLEGPERCISPLQEKQQADSGEQSVSDSSAKTVCVRGCLYDIVVTAGAPKVIAQDLAVNARGQIVQSYIDANKCIVRQCGADGKCVVVDEKSMGGESLDAFLAAKVAGSAIPQIKESPDLQRVLALAKTDPAAAQLALSNLSPQLQEAYKELHADTIRENNTRIQTSIDAIREFGGSNIAAEQDLQNDIFRMRAENQKLAQVNADLIASPSALTAPSPDSTLLPAGGGNADPSQTLARGDTFATASPPPGGEQSFATVERLRGLANDCPPGSSCVPGAIPAQENRILPPLEYARGLEGGWAESESATPAEPAASQSAQSPLSPQDAARFDEANQSLQRNTSPFGNNTFGGNTFGGNRFGGSTFGASADAESGNMDAPLGTGGPVSQPSPQGLFVDAEMQQLADANDAPQGEGSRGPMTPQEQASLEEVNAAPQNAQSPYGNSRFGGNTFGGNQFGGATFGMSAPLDRAATSQTPENALEQAQFAEANAEPQNSQSPYGNNTFGGNRYGGATYGGNTFGGDRFGASAADGADEMDAPLGTGAYTPPVPSHIEATNDQPTPTSQPSHVEATNDPQIPPAPVPSHVEATNDLQNPAPQPLTEQERAQLEEVNAAPATQPTPAPQPTPRPDGAPPAEIGEQDGICFATAANSSQRLYLVNRGYRCDATGIGSYSCTMQKGPGGCAPAFNPLPAPAQTPAPQTQPQPRPAVTQQGGGAQQPPPAPPVTVQATPPQPAPTPPALTQRMPLYDSQGLSCSNPGAFANQIDCKTVKAVPLPWQTGSNRVTQSQLPVIAPNIPQQDRLYHPNYEGTVSAAIEQSGGRCYSVANNEGQRLYLALRGYTCWGSGYPLSCSKTDTGQTNSCTLP